MSRVKFEVCKGQAILKYIDFVADFRLKYFREFPYLYDGNYDIENEYLDSFKSHENSVILVAKDSNKVVSICTGVPMESEFKIIQSEEAIFENSKDYYYIGEIIIVPEYRGQRIASRIFELIEINAKEMSFIKTCFLSVVREESHSLKPANYEENDPKWEKLGYRKTNKITSFPWPTIMEDGIVKHYMNDLVWWVKDLSTL